MRKNETTNRRAAWLKSVALGLMIALVPAAGTAETGSLAGDDYFAVLPSQVPLVIDPRVLLNNDTVGSAFLEFSDPAHGALTPDPANPPMWLYTPDKEFWVFGIDTFTYTVVRRNGVATATVVLTAERHGSQVARVDFEGLQGLGGLTPQGLYAVGSASALAGDAGLWLDADGADAYVTYYDEEDGSGDEGADDGSCDAKLRSPGGRGRRLADGDVIEILSIGSDLGPPGLQIMMRRVSGALQVGALLPGDSDNDEIEDVDWIDAPEGPFDFAVDWWKSSSSTAPDPADGMVLVVDGAEANTYSGIGIDGVTMSQYNFGAMSVPAYKTAAVDYDDIVVRTGGSSSPAIASLLVDDFEQDVSSSWVNGMITGLTTTAAAAQTGNAGLEIDLYGSPPRYLQQDYPLMIVTHLGIRFWLNPNDLPTSLQGLVVLDVTEDRDGAGAQVFRLRFRSNGRGYEVRAEYPAYNGFTDWLPIGAGNMLELRWRAASRFGNADGSLGLWIGGSLGQVLVNLPNDGRTVKSLRLGDLTGQGQARSFYIDNFSAWTRSIFVPASSVPSQPFAPLAP